MNMKKVENSFLNSIYCEDLKREQIIDSKSTNSNHWIRVARKTKYQMKN